MKPEAVVFALLFVTSFNAGAQGTPPQRRFADRYLYSNEWQLAPRTPKAAPATPVERATRDARDRGFDSVGAEPLDEELAKNIGRGRSVCVGRPLSDVPLIAPDQVVIVGAFYSWDAVLTASRKSIYTEMHMTVERVLNPVATLSPGSIIDILTPGGAVYWNSGQVLRDPPWVTQLTLVPHRRYILFLKYTATPDSWVVRKSIELRDGMVLPNTLFDLEQAEQGTWPWLDKREEEVIADIEYRLRRASQAE